MKIEKGKLYYNHQLESVVIAVEDGEDKSGILSNKIAVHCPTKEDKLYVSEKYNLESVDGHSSDYILINDDDACGEDYPGLIDYKIISFREFKEFYPPISKEEQKDIIVELYDAEKEEVLEEVKDKVLFIEDIENARKSLAGVDLSVISNRTSNVSKEEVTVDGDFRVITESIAKLLEYKNDKYGNAVLEPLQVFSDKCKAGTRLDDKLSRIKNSKELRKNDIADLIGYLILTCKENGWTDFSEFKD